MTRYLVLFCKILVFTFIMLMLACGGKEESKTEITTPVAPPAQPPGPSKPPDMSERCIVIATSGVNLRDNPNTNAKVVEKLPLGTTAEILAVQGDWYQLKTANGKTGWSASKFNNDYLLAENGPIYRSDAVYFPFVQGAGWDYKSTNGSIVEHWSIEQGIKGNLVLKITDPNNPNKTQEYELKWGEDGSLVSLSSDNYSTSYKPSVLFFAFDPRPGRIHAARSRLTSAPGASPIPRPDYETIVLMTYPQESVVTPAGSFDSCFKLEKRTLAESGATRSEKKETLWFAQGVGVVRIDRADGSLILGGYTPVNIPANTPVPTATPAPSAQTVPVSPSAAKTSTSQF